MMPIEKMRKRKFVALIMVGLWDFYENWKFVNGHIFLSDLKINSTELISPPLFQSRYDPITGITHFDNIKSFDENINIIEN